LTTFAPMSDASAAAPAPTEIVSPAVTQPQAEDIDCFGVPTVLAVVQELASLPVVAT
jgi:hypothetical protein